MRLCSTSRQESLEALPGAYQLPAWRDWGQQLPLLCIWWMARSCLWCRHLPAHAKHHQGGMWLMDCNDVCLAIVQPITCHWPCWVQQPAPC